MLFFLKYRINYKLKDYIITDKNTASTLILNSEGRSSNVSLENILTYNTLNSFLRTSKGNYLSFLNSIQAPTSSNNVYIKNRFPVGTSSKFL